jgi:hypothetical protein
MCAVFGGIYCLRQQATAAIIDSNNKYVNYLINGYADKYGCKLILVSKKRANRYNIARSRLQC